MGKMGAILGLFLLCHSTWAIAEVPQCDPGASEEFRLKQSNYLSSVLKEQQRSTAVWKWSWVGILSTTVVLQGGLTFLPDSTIEKLPFTRESLWIGAARSGIGVASFFVLPVKVNHPDLGSSQAGSCEEIDRLTRALQSAARYQRKGKGLGKHLSAAGLSIAGGTLVGVLTDEWLSAGIFAASGFLVSELVIWTQPYGAASAWERYKKGTWNEKTSIAFRAAPWFTPSGAGLQLGATW